MLCVRQNMTKTFSMKCVSLIKYSLSLYTHTVALYREDGVSPLVALCFCECALQKHTDMHWVGRNGKNATMRISFL